MTAPASQEYCIDRRVGCLLLPYGLHTLSDQDLFLFEEHLMRCPACHNELWSVASLLHSLYLQRMMLVEHFRATERSFDECMCRLILEHETHG